MAKNYDKFKPLQLYVGRAKIYFAAKEITAEKQVSLSQ